MTPATEEFGPGKNGWPAHGFNGTSFMKLECYCREQFTSKMALNRHVEAAIIAARDAEIAAAVRELRKASDFNIGAVLVLNRVLTLIERP